MTKDCKMCDKEQLNEYGEPCMNCHTFLEKQRALIISKQLEKGYKEFMPNNPSYFLKLCSELAQQPHSNVMG